MTLEENVILQVKLYFCRRSYRWQGGDIVYDVTQVERQLHVLQILSLNSRGFSIQEIKNNLSRIGINVSEKTIQRDLDFISNAFFVYEDKRGTETVYYAKKYSIKNIAFTIPELISLHFIRQILNWFDNLDVGRTAIHIIEKIIASTPQINQKYLEALNESIKVNINDIKPDNEIKPEYLELLKKAIEEECCVEIEYYAFNKNEVNKRVIDPYLFEIYDGCVHVIAYCHLRDEIRDFRVSRINKMQLCEQSFQKPKDFYQEYKRKRFNRLTGDNEVEMRLLFTGEAARYIEEYEASKADSLERVDGGLVFQRIVAMSPEILKWVLSFGEEVKVLEPTSLRDEVVTRIQKMQNLYNHP